MNELIKIVNHLSENVTNLTNMVNSLNKQVKQMKKGKKDDLWVFLESINLSYIMIYLMKKVVIHWIY